MSLVDWIIARAKRTPYYPIMSPDGTEMYMDRHWLFNPYGKGPDGEQTPARWSWLPSVRLHHILVPDSDRHLHDHPWNARTIILRGWYREERDGGQVFTRRAGTSARLRFGQFHRITKVSPGGVWTIFITGRYRGTWGFKMPWREYLAERDKQSGGAQHG